MSLKAPRPQMPSLKSLRAFEAAARHESFLKASEELAVTPGAIAQQVRHLEEWIGRKLFFRHPHGVRLTREAAQAVGRLGEAFDALGSAVQLIRNVTLPNEVRVAALPSVAQLWLAPRLPTLKREFPDLEISISALEKPPNFKRDLYDLAVFYVAADGPVDANAITLQEDNLFPVCAPSLLRGDHPLRSPEDLSQHTLLHDDTWRDNWARWLLRAGVAGVSPTRGPLFSLFSLALQTAIDGDGVLIGRETLVDDAIRDGRLVRPFELSVAPGDRLTLLSPRDRELSPRQIDVIEWVRTSCVGVT